MALENPAAGLLLWGAGGSRRFRLAMNHRQMVSYQNLEARLTSLASISLMSSGLRGLLGERLYEQVIGPFLFVKHLCDAKDKQSSEYVGQRKQELFDENNFKKFPFDDDWNTIGVGGRVISKRGGLSSLFH